MLSTFLWDQGSVSVNQSTVCICLFIYLSITQTFGNTAEQSRNQKVKLPSTNNIIKVQTRVCLHGIQSIFTKT